MASARPGVSHRQHIQAVPPGSLGMPVPAAPCAAVSSPLWAGNLSADSAGRHPGLAWPWSSRLAQCHRQPTSRVDDPGRLSGHAGIHAQDRLMTRHRLATTTNRPPRVLGAGSHAPDFFPMRSSAGGVPTRMAAVTVITQRGSTRTNQQSLTQIARNCFNPSQSCAKGKVHVAFAITGLFSMHRF